MIVVVVIVAAVVVAMSAAVVVAAAAGGQGVGVVSVLWSSPTHERRGLGPAAAYRGTTPMGSRARTTRR